MKIESMRACVTPNRHINIYCLFVKQYSPTSVGLALAHHSKMILPVFHRLIMLFVCFCLQKIPVVFRVALALLKVISLKLHNQPVPPPPPPTTSPILASNEVGSEGGWAAILFYTVNILQTEQNKLKVRMVRMVGSVTYLLDVTTSNPLPHPLLPSPIPLCLTQVWRFAC